MKIIYMSHRYHTNQNEIMHGWKERGDDVLFLTQFKGKIEDYTYIKPVTIGYAGIFNLWDKFYMSVLHRNSPTAKDMKLKYGIPPMHKLNKVISEFNPDLIILRERSLYTIFAYFICKKKHYRTILYNLSPVWAEPGYYSHDISHRIVRKLTPKYRMTPTHQIGIDINGKVRDPYSFYAPFLVKPICPPDARSYYAEGHINVFEIGKYQQRKNHFLMVNVVQRLKQKYPNIRLVIAGELSDHFHKEYYDKLNNYISEKKMQDTITLKQNLSKEEVGKLYRHADIFVVPSTGEPASITVIEAMAYSVLSISGSDNGTADYIKPGMTGEVFEDGNEDDLYNKMDYIIEDKCLIPQMGCAGYKSVLEEFQFKNYYAVIEKIMEEQEEDNK